MEVKELKIEIKTLKLEQLNPAKYNPRKELKPGDPEFEKLKRSIETFGFVELIVANKRTGFTVISGHQRLSVLKHLKWSEVECVIVDLDQASEKALNITMNKVRGEFDVPRLTDVLMELDTSGFDVSLTGFDLAEINELFGKPDTKEDDFDADETLAQIETPITKPGDIWLLGKHRLLCGSSTSTDCMALLMNGNEADLVLTDPPYNVDYQGGTKDKLKIQNDRMKDEQFLQFLTEAFKRMYEYSKKGAPIYVFHADSEGYNFRNAFKQAGYQLRQCLVWVKNSMVMGRQDYQWQHEPVLYGWKDGSTHKWYGDRKQTTIIKFDKPYRNAEHPTMKPVGLCGYFICNSSKEGDLVLDPFGGSGSTLIACEQTGRTCYTLELDEKYVDVIVSRYRKICSNSIYLLREGDKIEYSDLKKD